MGFAEINGIVASRGGTWFKLTRKEHGTLSGKILNADVRDKMFEGKIVPVTSDGPNKGKPRKEWVFTLQREDGSTVKYAANENAQWAISGALQGRKMQEGGHLQIKVVEDPPTPRKQAEYKAVYTDPTKEFDFPAETSAAEQVDEPPF